MSLKKKCEKILTTETHSKIHMDNIREKCFKSEHT